MLKVDVLVIGRDADLQRHHSLARDKRIGNGLLDGNAWRLIPDSPNLPAVVQPAACNALTFMNSSWVIIRSVLPAWGCSIAPAGWEGP